MKKTNESRSCSCGQFPAVQAFRDDDGGDGVHRLASNRDVEVKCGKEIEDTTKEQGGAKILS
jgi:hypothetical protein